MTEKEAIHTLQESQDTVATFNRFPPEIRTIAVSTAAVSLDPKCLTAVPYDSITRELLQKACGFGMERNILLLPPDRLTEEISLMVTDINPETIFYVPVTPPLLSQLLEKEFFLETCNNTNYIGLFKEPDQLLEAAKLLSSSSYFTPGDLISVIHPDHITDEVIDFLIRKDPQGLKYLSDEQKTKERCSEVVAKDAKTLGFVPDTLKDKELCRVALENNSEKAIPFIPPAILPELDLIKAVRSHPELLGSIPLELRNREMQVGAAVTGNSKVIPHLTDPEAAIRMVQQKGFYHMAIEDPTGIYNSFRQEAKTPEFVHAFLHKFPEIYPSIPESMKEDKELALQVTRWDISNISHIKDEFKSDELCQKAMNVSMHYLQAFPPRKFTPDFCNHIVEIDQQGIAAQWIPREQMTPDLCRLIAHKALTQYTLGSLTFKYIPYPNIIADAMEKAKPSMAILIYKNMNPAHRIPRIMKIGKYKAKEVTNNDGTNSIHVPKELHSPKVQFMMGKKINPTKSSIPDFRTQENNPTTSSGQVKDRKKAEVKNPVDENQKPGKRIPKKRRGFGL